MVFGVVCLVLVVTRTIEQFESQGFRNVKIIQKPAFSLCF
jgi:hypothetical protein